MTVTTGYGNQYLSVWIDFNDDLEYTSDELILENYIIAEGEEAGLFTETINVLIPSNALLGNHLMRAKTNWSGPVSNDACDTTTYGETEDYTVNIIETSLNISSTDFVNMKLYPNPTKGEFIIDFSKSINELEILIYDINGRVIYEHRSENKSRINLNPNISAGLYFVKIISSNQSSILKLIKK